MRLTHKALLVLISIILLASFKPFGLTLVDEVSSWFSERSSLDYYSDVELPIGMNISSNSYYTTQLIFTDVMKTASPFLTSYVGGPWDTDVLSEIERDPNGYPTYLPQTVDGNPTYIRFLINNHYTGTYHITFEGQGILEGSVYLEDGEYYVDLNGTGNNTWINLTYSDALDPVRNIKILPNGIDRDSNYQTFLDSFLTGLKPFHALRFMTWSKINNDSTQIYWDDRPTNTYYTQGEKGVSLDYAIELCEELDSDAWICVPHKASDAYIRSMAELFYDNFDSERKIYLEYSNELWNWMFTQSHWILNNAVDAVDTYISSDLAGLADFPEKDAYMMARTFRIWKEVFGNSNRLICVAAGQAAWVDNLRRILVHLFDVDGIGCDAVAVGGYFGFKKTAHDSWISDPNNVDAERILIDTLHDGFDLTEEWAESCASWAKQYGVDFLVYEGGQHMQPYNQQEWSYNQALYDAQLHPYMYTLYMENFKNHMAEKIDCKMFMAFAYVAVRETKYGSWGHLESYDQLGSNYYYTAPKYQALLDANFPK